MASKKNQSAHKSGKGKKPPMVGGKHPAKPSVHPDTPRLSKREEEPKPWQNTYAKNKGL